MMHAATYFVILSAVAFEVFAQLCLKLAVVSGSVGSGEGAVRGFWPGVVRSGWTYAGIAAYVVEICLWIAALHFAPLSKAFPLMSLTYCGVAIVSRLVLKERISLRSAVGIALITLGVLCAVGA